MKRTIQGIDYLHIVSAPSGTGKTSLNKEIMTHHRQFKIAVSHTTRKKRPGEVDGVDYHFTDHENFMKNVEKNEMLEWANVFGCLYGTHLGSLEKSIEKGVQPILEIDVQGCLQVQEKISNTKSIFIFPPSIEELWTRLESRGTDDFETRKKRILSARKEIQSSRIYDQFVVNDDFLTAFSQLEKIFLGEDHSLEINHKKGIDHCEKLLQEFELFESTALKEKRS